MIQRRGFFTVRKEGIGVWVTLLDTLFTIFISKVVTLPPITRLFLGNTLIMVGGKMMKHCEYIPVTKISI